MPSITVQFENENDSRALVKLLAEAIGQALREPCAEIVAAIRGGSSQPPSTSPAKPTEPNAQLVDLGTVAAMLGVSSKMVYRLRDAGKMPRPVPMGRLLRWRRQDITEWIEARCPRVERRGYSR